MTARLASACLRRASLLRWAAPVPGAAQRRLSRLSACDPGRTAALFRATPDDYQIVEWLRLGHYVHVSAKTEWPSLATSVQVGGWVGMNKLVDWFLDLNGGLQLIACAGILAWGLYSLPRLKASQ